MSKPLVAITGASSGIGAAFARRLAPEHDLLLIARRRERLEELAAELHAATGSQINIQVADLTAESDLASVADRVGADPRLVLLINNAGFGTKGRFWEAPLEEQENMHKLHVMATVRLTHAALRNFAPRDVGGIINVASVAAWVRRPGSASYAATKTWMTTFTEAVHVDLRSAKSNVIVQALCPGFTYTEFHDRIGLDRRNIASEVWWHSAEEIVESSLEGLRRRKLFVIPGWRYRALVALLSKIPAALRIGIEARLGGRARSPARVGGNSTKALGG